MDFSYLVKKLKLRLHLLWSKIYFENPEDDPTILTRRPKKGMLISLRNEEYASYMMSHDSNELQRKEKEPRVPLAVLSCVKENELRDSRYSYDIDARNRNTQNLEGTLAVLRNIVDYGVDEGDYSFSRDNFDKDAFVLDDNQERMSKTKNKDKSQEDSSEEEREEEENREKKEEKEQERKDTGNKENKENKENIVPLNEIIDQSSVTGEATNKIMVQEQRNDVRGRRHRLRDIIFLRLGILKEDSSHGQASRERASRMTLDSNPLMSTDEIRGKNGPPILTAMDIPGVIRSHSNDELQGARRVSSAPTRGSHATIREYRIDVLKEKSRDKMASLISSRAPTFGFLRNLDRSLRFPSQNPEIFKTVINDVSLNAALIANGNGGQNLKVDKSNLDAGLTNLNHYERLDQNNDTPWLVKKRRFSTGTDLTDIIGSYQ